MIITENVYLKINSKTISHYLKLGYKVEINKEHIIKVKDLTHGCKSKIEAKCDICENIKIVTYKEYCRNTKKYNIFCCSNKCAVIKNNKTSLEKYGVKHYSKSKNFIEKVKKTNLNKFGKEYYTQTEEYKNKIKNKIKNKDYTEIKNKIKKTSLEKYGVENYHNSQDYKNNKNDIILKYKKTIENKLLNKYDNLISTDNKNYKFICKKEHDFEISRELLKNRIKYNTEICTICNPINSYSISGYELQLQEFIKNNYNKEIILNTRNIISPRELDIYLPDLKLAFEFNGLYWHSELNKENKYHLNKTEECEKKGIQLIHIYEDDWIYKQEIVKSMILNKLGKSNKIYARKTKVKEVTDNKLIKIFLNENHIQGFVGSKIKLGLFYENELVSLMTFGKRRVAMGKKKSNDDEYELLRFCNKLNTNIIGGASKMFKYFLNNYNPKEIITYADRSYSQGKLYEKLGFEYKNKTEPNYYYIIDGIRKYRFNFRKDVLIKEGFDSNKTEHQIMLERKIFRIYDSGNLKFNYKKC